MAIKSDQLSVISKQLKKTDNCLLLTGFNRMVAPLAESLQSPSQSPISPPCSLPHQRRLPPSTLDSRPSIGGGRIIGEACHFIDFITFLVGAAPVSVTAHCPMTANIAKTMSR
ncbi:MAG: hypothetical protein U0X92_18885 [Anaerolineales bacterium]